MLALDHRESLKKLIDPQNPEGVTSEFIARFKKEIISAVYDQISGLLIDPEYGYVAYLDLSPASPKPFLLPLEKSGYQETDDGRLTIIEKNAKEIKEMGAAGAKLLIYFNPSMEIAAKQIETAKKAIENAHSENLPLFLEVVTYDSIPVVESLKKLLENDVKPDVYKLEYPGSSKACEEITKLLGEIPWILLTKGDDFEAYCTHLKEATMAGCHGFLAGRSLWKEAAGAKDLNEREKFIKEILPKRFERICEIAG